MSEEEVGKIFDPFYSSKSVGRGLGLAAVHGIVRSHRGSISVDSEIGKFTRVRVAFPVENDTLIDQTPPDERRVDDAWTPSGTVLVADDEPGVRSITARMLEEIGFDVVVADDGESATLIFERSPDAFCACLFDVTMPRKDGVQALHDVRSLRPTQPAVLFSGYSEKFSEIREIENGHTSFLEKPFRAAMLREKLEGVLTHSEGRAPSAAHGATPPLPEPPDTHSQVAQMVQPAAESDSHETP
jgi:CheY-like chemotaxis protein